MLYGDLDSHIKLKALILVLLQRWNLNQNYHIDQIEKALRMKNYLRS